ncbi:MAG: hypothetical protein RBT76_12520 [candidate division Zixibacteria bacterium]|jgi:hypothetical protein|nr:hypothetical protein [candidate division Zixibacteria bacterium]
MLRPNHKQIIATVLAALIAFALVGCGYLMSGTWEDDPGNWQRAFNTRQPDDVTVVHSLYKRMPHFTYEFEYYFQIEANAALREQLFQGTDMVRVEGGGDVKRCHTSGPSWFVPKAPEKYEVWRCRDRFECSFTVFIDTDTGDLFLTDRQV